MMSDLHFLSTDIPVGAKLDGSGTLKLMALTQAADPTAGKQVYASTCVADHGGNGQEGRRGKRGDANGCQFSPLWGQHSYNNCARTACVTLEAGFIAGNMPSGVTHVNAVLTCEQALDIAAYVSSQLRPVKSNFEADFEARKNNPVDAAFEPYAQGLLAAQPEFASWPPNLAAREKGIFPPK